MPYSPTQPALTDLQSIVRENPKNVVFFTGAGVGKFSGLPLWVELRRGLCSDIQRHAHELPIGKAVAQQLATAATKDPDLWNAFATIRTALGPLYNECLRRHLTPRRNATNPVYDRIWRLNVKGIVSFNIDRLPLDSYSAVHGRTVDFATTSDVHKIGSHLQTFTEFVFLPHGTLADPRTWVFDRSTRNDVLTSAAVANILNAIFIARRLVIVGLNPNDISFEKHLVESLSPLKNSDIHHYVIADETTAKSLSGISNQGFRLITYKPADVANHKEVIEILDSLVNFVPKDTPVSPASAVWPSPSSGAKDTELVVQDVERLRHTLTSLVHEAVRVHSSSEDAQVNGIREVYDKFPRSIQSSWIVRTDGGEYSRLFGRRVVKVIGEGAFGKVFLTEDGTGRQEAAKVLLQQEVNSDPRHLMSFLRGVQSMRILNRQRVDGMVQVHDAYEIPTCVFMEFIDGMTLADAVTMKRITALVDVLDALIRIGEIVDGGHRLDERVLHRDLKPANVMIRHGDGTALDIQGIVVLDFDLSWHRGASDRSVFHGKRAEGYAAPEQIVLQTGVSTRHVAVDVFGLGMIGFFMFVGRDPRAGEHKFPDFETTVFDGISALSGCSWKSMVPHLTNVVKACTNEVQSLRPGFSDVVADLARCRLVLKEDKCRAGDSLLLEEIALHLNGHVVERLDFGRKLIVRSGPRSVVLEILDSVRTPSLSISVEKLAAEHDERSKGKYIPGRTDRAVKHLRQAGFVVTDDQRSTVRTVLGATIQRASFSRTDAKNFGDAIRNALADLELA